MITSGTWLVFSWIENAVSVCLWTSSSSNPEYALAVHNQLVHNESNLCFFVRVSNSLVICNCCSGAVVSLFPPFPKPPLPGCMFWCAAAVLHSWCPWHPCLPSCTEVHQHMHLVPTLISTEINQDFSPAFSWDGIWLYCETKIKSGLQSSPRVCTIESLESREVSCFILYYSIKIRFLTQLGPYVSKCRVPLIWLASPLGGLSCPPIAFHHTASPATCVINWMLCIQSLFLCFYVCC